MRIFRILGTPGGDIWPDAVSLPDFSKINFPIFKPIPLELVIPRLLEFPTLTHLLILMTLLDPNVRPTAETCLKLLSSSSYYSTRELIPKSLCTPSIIFVNYNYPDPWKHAKEKALEVVKARNTLLSEPSYSNTSIQNSCFISSNGLITALASNLQKE